MKENIRDVTKKNEEFLSQKAITLISLIVTIIILLILAGVTISLILGDNGLFNTAKNATEQYEESQIKEELEIAIVDIQLEEINNNRALDMATIVNKLPQKIKNNGEEVVIQMVRNEAEGIYKGKKFIITEKFEVIINGEIEKKLTIIPHEVQKNENGIYTLPNLEIYNPNGETAKAVMIQFVSGITKGDNIRLKDSSNKEVLIGESYIYIKTKQATTDEIVEYLRNNLEFKLQKTDKIENITIKISLTDQEIDKILTFCSATNHYYEFVPASGITWTDAKIAAEQREYFGQKGYLATITSKEEDEFAASLINGFGWLGGTCHYEYIYDKSGNRIYSSLDKSLWNWYWVTGPEAGEKFWDRTGTLDKYSHWKSGEPNNSSGEYFLHLYKDNEWNDFANGNSQIAGYIVEYGTSGDSENFAGDSKASAKVMIEL